MEKVRIAVIGYGGMGSWHAGSLLEMEKYDLIGVWDIKPERLALARERGIRAFNSFEELLEEKPDVVTIATYNECHKPIAIDCMRAGINVISEKPVTLSTPDLEEMIAVSEETGMLFTVHQNRRWDNDYLTTKNIMEKNVLGRVFRIESRVQGSRGIPGDWRCEKIHGGGMLYDWGVHLLDQALTLNDSNKLVSVYAHETHITDDECDDGFYAELLFENGLRMMVEVTTNNFIALPRWYILGENGTSTIKDWDLEGKTVLVHDWNKIDAVPVKAGTGITKTMAPRTDETIREQELDKAYGDWLQYYDNIYDIIKNGAEQIITHRQMRRCIALIETIRLSAQENRVVPFDDIYTAQ